METDDRELVKKYGEIHGDYAKLNTQLENLRNMKGTIIKISIRAKEGLAQITISDTGAGIPTRLKDWSGR